MESMLRCLEERIEDMEFNVVDIADFNERVVGAYNNETAEKGLEADDGVARSIIPASTGPLRDFSYIAPHIPLFVVENCVGCMDCVTPCPATAILAQASDPSSLPYPPSKPPLQRLGTSPRAQWP